MSKKRELVMTERQIRQLVADAAVVAAAAILYAPEVEQKAHAAGVRIMNKFTDWRKPKGSR